MSDNTNLSDAARQRRGSIGAGFTNMFRSNSVSQGPSGFPGPISTAMSNDKGRRLSISTLGLGNSPTASFNARRSSMSTNSDSIDENAVEEDDGMSRTAPTTPFTRRMSFGAQAMRNMRGSGSSPNASNDQGFNWSEQLRSRAESNVTAGGRPSLSFASGVSTSPPRGNSIGGGSFPHHDRAKSVSEMPAPPAQAPRPRPQKPDHIQERILKGDFYMD